MTNNIILLTIIIAAIVIVGATIRRKRKTTISDKKGFDVLDERRKGETKPETDTNFKS